MDYFFKAVEVKADGESNFYRLVADGDWLAVVQLNGKFLVAAQEAIMRQFAEAITQTEEPDTAAQRSDEPTTNAELFEQMLTYSRYGALAQAFVVDAVTKMAEQVAKLSDEEVAKLDETSMVHMRAWRGVAREIKAKMDAFYSR